MKEQDIARFWAKVEKTEGCWIWTGATFHRGYGAFQFQGKTRKAHRIAFTLTHGPIPEGLFVCHACDNPSCVRPDHLWIGTSADNANDRNQKGRTCAPHNHHRGGYKLPAGSNAGERNPRAKLNWPKVHELRARYASGVELLKHLAAEYGIAFSTADKVIRFETWKEEV